MGGSRRLWRTLTDVSLQACELLVPGVRAEEWAVVDLVPIAAQVGLWWGAARDGSVSTQQAVDVLDGWAEHRVQTAEGIRTGAAALLDALRAGPTHASPSVQRSTAAPHAGHDPGLDAGLELDLDAVRAWRSYGDAIVTVLTAPGDPGILTGPAAATARIMQVGQAVVHNGLAWTPRAFGAPDAAPYYVWEPVRVRPPRPVDVGEARTAFLSALTSAETTLEAIGLAPHGKSAAGPVDRVRKLCRRIPLPPGRDQRTITMLEQATLILGAVSLATRTGSTAVHAHDARAFEDALRPLAQSARQALATASSEPGVGVNRVGP